MRLSTSGILKGKLCCLLITITCISQAQNKNPYSYQELSNFSYVKLRDSLKKNWVCPALYTNKETQKKFKELWDSRTEMVINGINNNDFINEKEIYNYLDAILSQIVSGNPKLLPKKPILLIDRSSSVNAYAIGGNLFAVNLGLIAFSENREEVALVIAHELSHNILQHPENSMKERAEWLTSDEYKKSLNSILDSKYERYSRLKKVFEGFSFDRNRHSRYHESDADSLAVVILKNSHIPFDAKFFLRLDSTDEIYKKPLMHPVKDFFLNYNLHFEDTWTQKRSRGLSTRNYSFKDTSTLSDSLKTHPDCIVRYEKTKSFSTPGATLTPVEAGIREKANKMIIWNIYDNQNLTACLYRVLQEKDKGNKDEWYDFMFHNVFAGLCYSDNQLNRFNAIHIVSKEYVSQNYIEVQNMLEQIPKESLFDYCKALNNQLFWQKMPSDARALKSLFVTLTDKETSEKARELAAKDFTFSNSNSMYCEFANHFIKK